MPFQVLNVPETRKLIKQIPVCRDIRWKENRQYIQLFTTAEAFDYWAFQHSRGLL